MAKKVKIVGTKRLIDPETGEEVLATVEVVNGNRKFGWEAIWLGTLLETLEIITNKGFRVAKFLLSERIRTENVVIATIPYIAEKTGLSEKTVRTVMRKLLAANFITRVQRGVYRVNPAVIWRGKESHRQAILIKFQNENAKSQKVSVQEDSEQGETVSVKNVFNEDWEEVEQKVQVRRLQ